MLLHEMNRPIDEHIADYIGLDERLRLGNCVCEITSCRIRNKKHQLSSFHSHKVALFLIVVGIRD